MAFRHPLFKRMAVSCQTYRRRSSNSRCDVQSLYQLSAAMRKLAGGDFDVVLPGLERKDEIGAMANAVEEFKVVSAEKAHNETEEVVRRQKAEAEVQAKAAAEQRKSAEAQAQAAQEQAEVVNLLAERSRANVGRQSRPSPRRGLHRELSPDQGRLQRHGRAPAASRSARSRRRRGRSPTPPASSRRAPPICRSAPRSRPRASKKPRPRWRRSPRR